MNLHSRCHLPRALRSRPGLSANRGVGFFVFLCAFIGTDLWFPTVCADEPSGPPVELKNIKYRLIGPNAGGRVSRACGIPGDPLTYYLASASGGVWKSTDGGQRWKPIFDNQSTASIGSIAVAASDPGVIYVGTGEANIRGNVAEGNGIYKSVDGGRTWKHVWKQRGQIGQMIVHPKNPDIAFAAVLGRPFGPNPERGVYRTTDGGRTWQQVLKKDADTGAIDVCFDPNNPHILFAALWQARRTPWSFSSGGPGSGLYRSSDGGDTWQKLGPREEGKKEGVSSTDYPLPSTQQGSSSSAEQQHDKRARNGEEADNGLPAGPYGRIGIAVAPADSRRVYALIEAKERGLYRSDDGGNQWKLVGTDAALQQRPWYFSTVHVDPRNKDVVWCPNVRLLRSIDGGRTWKQVKGPHHVDHHDLWIDPTDPRRLLDSNDGGVDISLNGGETWFAPLLPLSQFYHISTDNRRPYHVLGNLQDIGTAAGPSNSLSRDGIALRDWYPVGGGETGFALADPSDPDVVYAGEYGGYLSRFDRRTRQAHNISPYPYNVSGKSASELKYRFPWTAPLLVSVHDPKTIYHGGNVLFRSNNRGQSWRIISPDLTRNDTRKQQFSGGPLTGDNVGTEIYCTIFALAESPKKQGLLWVGTDDGLVHVATDGGKSWKNVTPPHSSPLKGGEKGWPEWGTVKCLEASPHDEQTVYLVVDAHRLDDVRPHLWKTSDLGQSWQNLGTKLPQDTYLHVVRADPKKKGLLYLGTERGVQISLDDGATWEPLRLNLPTVAVHDLVVKDDDLVVGTHGRSVWILDDLTPIRHLAELRRGKEKVQLLPAREATRWRHHEEVYSTADPHAHPNPPAGALLHYYLPEKVKGVLTLEILDGKGKVIRTITSKKKEEQPADVPDPDPKDETKNLPNNPGLHRVVWDLRHEGGKVIPKAKLDSGNPLAGPLVLPGTYTVRLRWEGGQPLTTSVIVQSDPRLKLQDVELAESVSLALQMRDDINKLVEVVEGIRLVRDQLQRRNELLEKRPQAAFLVRQSTALLTKLELLEETLHNPRAKVSYDILKQPGGAKLYSQLVPLYSALLQSDDPPAQSIRNLANEYRMELRRLEEQWRELLRVDLAELNQLARKMELPTILGP